VCSRRSLCEKNFRTRRCEDFAENDSTEAGQRTRFVCYVAVGDCERRARRLPRPRRVIYLWRSRRTYGYAARRASAPKGERSRESKGSAAAPAGAVRPSQKERGCSGEL